MVELLEKARLPAIYPWGEAAELGGLMAYYDVEESRKSRSVREAQDPGTDDQSRGCGERRAPNVLSSARLRRTRSALPECGARSQQDREGICHPMPWLRPKFMLALQVRPSRELTF